VLLGVDFTLWTQLAVAGIAAGAIYALAGMGVVLTYKATGVFNFAYGAIAVFVAYVVWQLNRPWHVPLPIAAPVGILVVGPGLGLLLERFVFRPLERRGATQAERLVAILGVFLLLVGLMYGIWTGQVHEDAPDLVSPHALSLGAGVRLGEDQLTVILLVVVISGLLWLLFRRTRIGLEVRAVVDRRELAELATIDANRVSAVAWALGSGFAGLTGVLLAPLYYLDPAHLTLLVVFETFSVAVVARLVSLPAAAATGIALGVATSLLTHFQPTVLPLFHLHLPSWFTELVGQLEVNLSAVVLLVALVVLRRLDEGVVEITRLARGSSGVGARRPASLATPLVVAALVVVALVLPWLLGVATIGDGQTLLALVIVFTSIVCITGFCGYITLGQAAFAGIGGFVAARAATNLHLPVVAAMLLGGLAAMALGFLTGYPVLNRRGLLLGLITLAVGLLAYNLVFTNNLVVGAGAIAMPRPSLFGLSLKGNHAFYYFELAWAALMVLLARNLRRGRLGRILAAMRDSETAARSVGIDLRRYKLFIFSVSAFIAGIGGTLLAEQAHVFEGLAFDPLSTSLSWFVVVVVAGITSLAGGIVGAGLYVLLTVLLHQAGLAELVFALLALLIGRLPGGSLVGLAKAVTRPTTVPAPFLAAYREAQRAVAETRAPAGGPPADAAVASARPGGLLPPSPAGAGAAAPDGRPALVPSPFARRVLAEAGQRRTATAPTEGRP
jgi:branched-chain amino acid transport system permease protein